MRPYSIIFRESEPRGKVNLIVNGAFAGAFDWVVQAQDHVRKEYGVDADWMNWITLDYRKDFEKRGL